MSPSERQILLKFHLGVILPYSLSLSSLEIDDKSRQDRGLHITTEYKVGPRPPLSSTMSGILDDSLGCSQSRVHILEPCSSIDTNSALCNVICTHLSFTIQPGGCNYRPVVRVRSERTHDRDLKGRCSLVKESCCEWDSNPRPLTFSEDLFPLFHQASYWQFNSPVVAAGTVTNL